ncbi:hypothetical protein DFH28DRAFT_897180, partial [Melampsora americana]
KALHFIISDLIRTHLMEEISEIHHGIQATQDIPPASQGDWVEKLVEVLIAKRSENISHNSPRSKMFVLPRVNSDSTVVMTAEEDSDSGIEFNSRKLSSNHRNRGPKRSIRSIKGSYPRRPMVIAPKVKIPPICPTEEFKELKPNVETTLENDKPVRLPSRQRVRDSIYRAVVRTRPTKRHEHEPFYPIEEESKTCPNVNKFEGEFDLVIYSPGNPSPNQQVEVQGSRRPERYIGPKPLIRSPIKISPITDFNDITTGSAVPACQTNLLRPKLIYTKHQRNFNASLYPLPSIPEAGHTEPLISCSEVIRSEARASFSSRMVFKTRPSNRQILESQLRSAEEKKNRISLNIPKSRKSIVILPKLIPGSIMIHRISEDRNWLSLNDSESGISIKTSHPERRQWLIEFCKLGLILTLLIPIIVLVIVFHKKNNIIVGISSS